MEGLALKYRPEVFEDVLGQDVSVSYLTALIKKGQRAKNLIISGSYGSGKTTSGRIYARALNCLAPSIGGSPCNICVNCDAFYTKSFPDYHETDGSSKGRIEDIEKLSDLARTPPLQGKYRIIVIDEAHGLSNKAWDSLLKIVEEPPPFLAFIFLTTEAGKIREAIKSRCQVLEVHVLDNTTSMRHLEHICHLEGFIYEQKALEILAHISKGHPRDLVTNLEQASMLGDINVLNVRGLFNLGYLEPLVSYCKGIFDPQGLPRVLKSIHTWPISPGKMQGHLSEYLVHLKYAHLLKTSIRINPSFSLIPEGDEIQLYAQIERLAHSKGLQPEELFSKIFGFFLANSMQNDIDKEIFSHELYTLLHVSKALSSAGAMTQASSSPRPDSKASKQRRTLVSPTSTQSKAQMESVATDPWAIKAPVQDPIAPVQASPVVAPVEVQLDSYSTEVSFDVDLTPQKILPRVSSEPQKESPVYNHTLAAAGFVKHDS